MPRPKRSKVAPSAPAPRVMKPTKSAPAANIKHNTPKTNFNDLYDISDPDEGNSAKARRSKRRSRGTTLEVQVNSRVEDGIEDEDVPNSTSEKRAIPGIPSEKSLLENVDLESSSPSMERGQRGRSIGAETPLSAIGNFKRRPRQRSILGRARGRSSSLESNLADDHGLMSVGRVNMSGLGNGTHRRRQRDQAAITQTHRARSSSIGLDMGRRTPAVGSAMKVGIFKRRAREPSVLGTARKKQQQQPDPYADEDDDFNPEDESTPLNLSKSNKRVSSSSVPSSSNSKKRKLSAVQVPQSQSIRSSPPVLSHTESHTTEPVPASEPLPVVDISDDKETSDEEENDDDDQAVPRSPSPELPRLSIEGPLHSSSLTPEPVSETMAPPRSSSSSVANSPTPPIPPPTRSRLQPSRGRRPVVQQRDSNSPPSSPPSLTHSPNRSVKATAPSKGKKKQAPPSTFSTAQLQALLLPQRRRRQPVDEFDIPSSDNEVDVSGLASDDDELTHSTIQAPPRRSIPVSRAKATPRPKPVARLKAGTTRTYASKAPGTSDKENDEDLDPDDSLAPIRDDDDGLQSENSQELEKRVGKELKLAARKFEEVDKWEMEFESVTPRSSSPKDAR